jgi:hypothetical protein
MRNLKKIKKWYTVARKEGRLCADCREPVGKAQWHKSIRYCGKGKCFECEIADRNEHDRTIGERWWEDEKRYW